MILNVIFAGTCGFCPTVIENQGQSNTVVVQQKEVDRVGLFEPTTSVPACFLTQLLLSPI
jgi:hypothetical protein